METHEKNPGVLATRGVVANKGKELEYPVPVATKPMVGVIQTKKPFKLIWVVTVGFSTAIYLEHFGQSVHMKYP